MALLHARHWLSALVLSSLVAGCTGSPPPAEVGSRLDAFRQEASAQQQPYFDDGAIEFAEYEEAVFATVTCIEGQGFHAEARLADDGFYQYGVTLENPAEQSRMDEAMQACRAEWSEQVEQAFQSLQAPESDDTPALIAVIDCLRDANERPTGGSSAQQLREFIERLADESPAKACADLLPEQ